jgi:putative tryptophan/tyrosine transport system substrate-binding protein
LTLQFGVIHSLAGDDPMMQRIATFAVAVALLAGVGGALAQTADAIPVIGVLRATSPTQHDPAMEVIRAELLKLGYTEGKNLRIEQRFANLHPERLPELAQELVQLKVRVLVAVNEASLRAARAATGTIPIVVVAYDHDPVAAGLIESTGRPTGNITGIFSRQLELVGKRLELLKETLPAVSRVAVLHDPATPLPSALQPAARQLGLQLQIVDLKSPRDFAEGFAQAGKKSQAVLLLFSPMIFDHRLRIATLAVDARLPMMSQAHEFVIAGALMSYSPDRTEVAARAAYFIDRLLRDAKPSDLPVEEAAKFKLTINLKTAKALGITIPQSILLRADEVIR